MVLFPPGATTAKESMSESRWMIFDFTLHSIQHWILPPLSISEILMYSGTIRNRLKESRRVRKMQIAEWDDYIPKTT